MSWKVSSRRRFGDFFFPLYHTTTYTYNSPPERARRDEGKKDDHEWRRRRFGQSLGAAPKFGELEHHRRAG